MPKSRPISNMPAKPSLQKAPQQPKGNAKTPAAPPVDRSPHKRIPSGTGRQDNRASKAKHNY